jgi:hypothetical protein
MLPMIQDSKNKSSRNRSEMLEIRNQCPPFRASGAIFGDRMASN